MRGEAVATNPATDYFVWGLHLRSDLPLPELAPAAMTCADGPMVEIRLGAAGRDIEEPRHVGPTYQAARNDYLLTVPNVARYRVRNGTEIIVEPGGASSARDVRLFLLGTAFGVLCHQRRLLPLHASAIIVDGRCIAFAGRSGAGKSTLATYFGDRGYPILADDICVLSLAAGEPPLAWPGVPNMKLWRDALAQMGRDPDRLDVVRDGLQKYHVPLAGQAAGAFPLARLYVLREVRLPRHEGIVRQAGAVAFDEVLNNTYRRQLLTPMGCAETNFTQCAALLKHVLVFSVGRRWGFDCFAEQAHRLERHFLGGVT
jgi:hypothetical protein